MENTPFPPSRLGRLFFSEVLLLASAGGILALRHPWPGLFCLALLWLLDLPRSLPRQRGLCLALAFALGLGYAALREPQAPPVPEWLATAACPAPDGEGEILPPQALRIEARVERCDRLPGNRLRTILKDLRPAGAADEQAYAGKCAWTWYRPEAEPLPGTDIAITVRLAPQRGFANPGTMDSERFWHDKGVFFRAWSGSKTDFALSGKGGQESWTARAAALRRDLRAAFVAALPRTSVGGSFDQAALGGSSEKDALGGSSEKDAPGGSSGQGALGGSSKKDAFSGSSDQAAFALSPSAAILPALIFGDRSFLTPEQSDLFARSTLAHSLALSGLHMGFAVLAGALLALGLTRAAPGLCLVLPRPKLALLLSLPFAALYLWLGQAPPSLCRAACMLTFFTLLLCLDKPRVLLDGLLAALAFLLLLDPLSLFDLGLQLSVLCVAVIALIVPGLGALGRRLFPAPGNGPPPLKTRLLRSGLGILGISFAIQAALLPLVLRAFGSSGLLFPLNLLWLPVLSAAVLPLAFLGLAACALLPAAAPALLWLADLPGAALLALLQALDAGGLLLAPLLPRPHWLSMAGYWLLCLSLPGLLRAGPFCRDFVSGGLFARRAGPKSPALPRKNPPSLADGTIAPAPEGKKIPCRMFSARNIWPAALALCLLLAPLAGLLWENRQPGVRLTLFDVGQGESLLIEWQGLGGGSGRALLDGGGFASPFFDTGKALLAPALTDQRLPRLNLVLNSHPDTDHLGGLPYILEHFSVGRYAGNGEEAGDALAARERAALGRAGLVKERLTAGRVLDLAPNLRLECLWPPSPESIDEGKGGAEKGGAKARNGPARKPLGNEKGNNLSLVLRLVWRGEALALFCGDLEKEGLQSLLDRAREQKQPLAAGVLVLPHHGSAGSLFPDLYQAVSPRLALASAGYGNRWGFPSAGVRRAVAERGIPLLDTARCGRIRLTWDAPGKEPLRETARPASP